MMDRCRRRSCRIPLAVPLLTMMIVLVAVVHAAPQKLSRPEAPAAVEATLSPGPVVFNGETLFVLRERALSIPPQKRAELIAARIRTLADSSGYRPESVTVSEDEISTNIVATDTLIMAVTDRDAVAAGKSRQELARQYADIIKAAIGRQRESFDPRTIIRSVFYAIGLTLLLAGLIWGVLRICRRLTALAESLVARVRDVRIFSYNIIRPQHLQQPLFFLLKSFRFVVLAVLVVAYLQAVLALFPWTHGIALRILDLIIGPLATMGRAVIGYIPNLFFVAVLCVVTLYVIRFIRFLFHEIDEGVIVIPGFHRDWALPTFTIVRFLVFAFVAVVAFPYIPGSESPAFKGVSLFIGVLFSLGSSSAIGNIVAGVILTYMRPFVVGDRVKIADTVGDIKKKELLVTRIRTVKNVEVTIPNSLILGSHIVNYSFLAKEEGLILHTSITIGYDAPWRTVHELLIAAARATTHVLPEPAPYVFQTALNDFYVTYEINAYTRQPNLMAGIYSELHRNIQEQFNRAGVEIMSPHYTQLRDGNTVTIPEAHRPAGYRPGALRVSRTGDGEG